jgi:hypothetical protein
MAIEPGDVIENRPRRRRMTPRQTRTLVLAIAITALVAAVPATKILSDRHALAAQKAKVSTACGVPVTIIWDPVADTTDGHERLVFDVDTRKLDVPSHRAYAVYDLRTGQVECKLA